MYASTWNLPCGAIELHHAIDLPEENSVACLKAMGSVVHARYHPRVALMGQMSKGTG